MSDRRADMQTGRHFDRYSRVDNGHSPMVFELTDILLESLLPASPAHIQTYKHTYTEELAYSKARSKTRLRHFLFFISYDL